MSDHEGNGVNRRKVLECMTWAGTGVLWTISGGVPRSLGLVDAAKAAEPAGLTFLQISDSHVGFDKPANPNALGTLEAAITKITAIPKKPSFIVVEKHGIGCEPTRLGKTGKQSAKRRTAAVPATGRVWWRQSFTG